MIEILKKLKENQTLVSLHFDEGDPTSVSVGYIIEVTMTHVLLESVSKDGMKIGYYLYEINQLFRIDYDGLYEQKISSLLTKFNGNYQHTKLDKFESTNLIMELLMFAKNHNLISILWLEDNEDSICGFVDKVENGLITISQIDDFGNRDGTVIIEEKTIETISVNDKKCQILNFLYNQHFSMQ